MKKYLIPFLFCLPFLAFAAPTPSLLGAPSTTAWKQSLADTTFSLPHTVPAGGTNTGLFVLACKSGASTLTGIKWANDVENMAQLVSFTAVAQCTGTAWYLGKPNIATDASIQFVFSASGGNFSAVIFTLQDVLQSTTTLMEGFGQRGNDLDATKGEYSTTTATAIRLALLG